MQHCESRWYASASMNEDCAGLFRFPEQGAAQMFLGLLIMFRIKELQSCIHVGSVQKGNGAWSYV
jgi:hypothetical protein